MRGSAPTPERTFSMSAPTRSASSASSFMKEMRVASMALAAYLMSSAERMSTIWMRLRLRTNGAYRSSSTWRPRSSSTPSTTRAGFMKSLTASPSLRNSGFEATANSVPRAVSATAARTRSAVPTGTVLLVAITAQPVRARPMSRAAVMTWSRLARPSSPCGVPTAMKITCAPATAPARSVVKRSRPRELLRWMRSSRPGS